MSETTRDTSNSLAKAAVIAAAFVFVYATVLAKLGIDWWTDENYSHGLLVPLVIAFIVWREWDALKKAVTDPAKWAGGSAILLAILLLLGGTLGAELFTQRMSLVLMLAGIIVYFFGMRILNLLAVPFALLLLAIPIPQIIFNRIAFPLQIWASQMAVWGIRLFDVPTLRKGNVIDILPKGSTQTLSLEVVEACSGIRSLMTLVTLALILAYLTRRQETGRIANFSTSDFLRAVLLMVSAIPIAVLTNAARVTATGVMTYHYGQQATGSAVHDASGFVVYLVALGLLVGVNFILKQIFKGSAPIVETIPSPPASRATAVLPLIVILAASGLFINWFVTRGEVDVTRKPLSELSAQLGDWKQRGSEIKFDKSIESVLRTTDYTMREYTDPTGRIANLYVGYYASQKSGATYHSPQNCLPGAGWEMRDPQTIDITTTDGRKFTANRYIIENGIYKEVMIYWYQGRGHTEPDEFRDKLNTIYDSVTRSRSDGSIVRVMTTVGDDESASLTAASDLAARLAEQLGPYVPE